MAQPAGLRPSPPCAIVIFGAAGDLTKRKLLPALYNLKASGLLPRQLAIIGVTRKEKSHEQFREEQSKDIREFATRAVDDGGVTQAAASSAALTHQPCTWGRRRCAMCTRATGPAATLPASRIQSACRKSDTSVC